MVDNTTDRDWDGVAVTLVSGRPVSFVQDLYSPEFLQRPVVRPERYAGLRPQSYDQDMELDDERGHERGAGGAEPKLQDAKRSRTDGRSHGNGGCRLRRRRR